MNQTIENKYNSSPYRIPLYDRAHRIIDYALVDKDDFERVNQYRWRWSHGYASASINGRGIFMHHFVFRKPSVVGNVIDHKNNDRLDNRKENLREVTRAENSHNVPKRSGTSQYKGVSLYTAHTYGENIQKYSASYSARHLGLFDDEESAARAYDTYTFVLYGKDARNNGLVRYEDVADLKLSDLHFAKQNNIPKHIYKIGNQYYALKKYNKKTYKKPLRPTIDEALQDLLLIKVQINHVQVMEELLYLQTPIPRNEDNIAIILCAGGEISLVDDEDWYMLTRIYTWHIDNGYVHSSVVGRIHRFLLKPKPHELVDHINNNRLDNRKCNLRIATYSLNNHNRPKQQGTKYTYRGVSKKKGKWTARISHQYKTYDLGLFDTELEAHEAYTKKAAELHQIEVR